MEPVTGNDREHLFPRQSPGACSLIVLNNREVAQAQARAQGVEVPVPMGVLVVRGHGVVAGVGGVGMARPLMEGLVILGLVEPAGPMI